MFEAAWVLLGAARKAARCWTGGLLHVLDRCSVGMRVQQMITRAAPLACNEWLASMYCAACMLIQLHGQRIDAGRGMCRCRVALADHSIDRSVCACQYTAFI
jgi:hypothetical protein